MMDKIIGDYRIECRKSNTLYPTSAIIILVISVISIIDVIVGAALSNTIAVIISGTCFLFSMYICFTITNNEHGIVVTMLYKNQIVETREILFSKNPDKDALKVKKAVDDFTKVSNYKNGRRKST